MLIKSTDWRNLQFELSTSMMFSSRIQPSRFNSHKLPYNIPFDPHTFEYYLNKSYYCRSNFIRIFLLLYFLQMSSYIYIGKHRYHLQPCMSCHENNSKLYRLKRKGDVLLILKSSGSTWCFRKGHQERKKMKKKKLRKKRKTDCRETSLSINAN